MALDEARFQSSIRTTKLDANADLRILFVSQIESFFDDHDYRSRFTREQLETSASSIINEKKYEKPIWDALKMANLTVVSSRSRRVFAFPSSRSDLTSFFFHQADLDSLILFGGNSRVPMVQAAIKAAVGE